MLRIDFCELNSAYHERLSALLFVCLQISEHSNKKDEDFQVVAINRLCEQKDDSGLVLFKLVAFCFTSTLNSSPSSITVEIAQIHIRSNTLKVAKVHH